MGSNLLAQTEYPLPAPARSGVDALVVAGEHSGDEHAARMVKAALARNPDLNIVALGGPNLSRAGAQVICDMMPYAIVGIFEILKHYGELKNLRDGIVEWVLQHRPKTVCFVDYPGLNLRLAKILTERNATVQSGGSIRLLYYISPQVWAWKANRRFEMAKMIDSLSVIFPFEVETFADTTLEPQFVGHPFVAADYELPTRYDAEAPVLLLPGSRAGAISRIAPAMFAALYQLRKRRPNIQARCIYASDSLKELLEEILDGFGDLKGSVEFTPNSDPTTASAVLTSSGTMSLNCALAGIPGAIVYRIHPLTYLFGKAVVKIPFIGIANLLLARPMYPELIQGDARADRLADELMDCLDSEERIRRTQEDSVNLREILNKPDGGGAGRWLVSQVELQQTSD